MGQSTRRVPDAARPCPPAPHAPRLRAARPHTQPCRHDPGHPGPARRLPLLPLREPRRPQRWRGRVRHDRQLRRVQPVYPARQLRIRPGRKLAARRGRHRSRVRRRACVGKPADRIGQRDRHRLRPAGRNRRGAGGRHVDRVRDTARGALGRWQAGAGVRRGLDVQDPDGEGPPQLPHHLRRRAGLRGGGGAPGRVPLQDEREPGLAADRGGHVRPARALVGDARLQPPVDRAAAGVRPLPRRAVRPGPHRHLRPPPGLVGQGPASRHRLPQPGPRAAGVFRRPDRADGGVQGRADRLPAGEHLKAMGHRLRLRSREVRPGGEAGPGAPAAHRHPGLDHEHPAHRV